MYEREINVSSYTCYNFSWICLLQILDYLPEWAGQKVKIKFDPLKHLLIILSVFKVI